MDLSGNLPGLSATPSLSSLSLALRNPEMWPTGFVWNYDNMTGGAEALAMTRWPKAFKDVTDWMDDGPPDNWPKVVGSILKLNGPDSMAVFTDVCAGMEADEVSPQHGRGNGAET